ncbi:hypothetical protein CTI12_AA139780 [Artemisia annua]|uniref:Complex 1 LYR protein domain-containing protein n=1 Tax=Artemisia annua TaxID=35608 RepID=A0A2U1PLF6_ARTAN|nr:hypothetical protein CTI12_AA139780 [Artemisia annua]
MTEGRLLESPLRELMQTIRQEMENNRDCNDRQRIRYLISEGMERLKNLVKCSICKAIDHQSETRPHS